MTDLQTLANSDPLFLGAELRATFQQRPLTVDELFEWMRTLLAITGDEQQLQNNANQASGVIWALYLTWRISAAEAEAFMSNLNNFADMQCRALFKAPVH